MSTHHGILLHAIFSTKFRRKAVSKAWSDDLYAYFGGTAREHEATVLCSGGIVDHVHLLLKVNPKYAISSTIQMLKANSSRWINEGQRCEKKFAWQRGYGAFSVSESLADSVIRYIKNQSEHHRKLTFCEEYLKILRKHNLEFDERFVFEEEIVA